VIPYGTQHSVAVPWNTSINGYAVPFLQMVTHQVLTGPDVE